jgi:hypothetical protein
VEAVVVILETAVAVEMKLLLLTHHQLLHALYLVLSVKVLTAVAVGVSNKVVVAVELVKLVDLHIFMVP